MGGSVHSFTRYLVGVLVLAVIAAACSGDNSGGGGESSTTTTPTADNDDSNGSPTDETASGNTDGPSSSEPATGYLGFVADPTGELINFATLGGAVTGASGLATDPVTAGAAGWIVAEAPGYATSYTTIAGVVNGANIVSTTLIPVGTRAFHPAGGEETVVTVGPTDAPTLELRFDPATFDEDAVIEVTALDLNLLDTVYAPMDTIDVLYVDHPFDIRARSAVDGSPLQLIPGQAVELTLTDAGSLGDPPRLFSFDPDSGQWLEQADAACDRIDTDHVGCRLSHFSHYSGGSATQPARSPARSDHEQATQTTDDLYNKNVAEMGPAPEGPNKSEVDCRHLTPDVVTAFEREAEIAIAQSRSRPSEGTKRLVLATTARMQQRGSPDSCPESYPGDSDLLGDLQDATLDVIEAMAQALLPEPLCQDIDKVAKVLQEAQFFTEGDGDQAELLRLEFIRLVDDCNVWEGRVEYAILLPDDVEPADIVLIPARWYSGARTWTEYHDITIALHTVSLSGEYEPGEFDGTDHVETNFPEVVYRRPVDETGCGFPVFETTSLVGAPNPGTIEVFLEGSLFGPRLTPTKVSAQNTISVNSGYFETGWAYDSGLACIKEPDFRTSFDRPYAGQIAERQLVDDTTDGQLFIGSLGAQLSSLWEVIEAGPTRSVPSTGVGSYSRDFYNGSEILYEVVVPWLLFDMRVVMRWDIVHTNYPGT